ncbi:hypothetical protein TrST_g12280 [Triparma strigata]|uniref:SAM domain-containing protein n=1 Tax=Triparma strigata TaxID=1606541 RepID=A0A9W7ES99_9STRA|nr:hypothetical protein TrST_g12280 [Triparma strigata]
MNQHTIRQRNFDIKTESKVDLQRSNMYLLMPDRKIHEQKLKEYYANDRVIMTMHPDATQRVAATYKCASLMCFLPCFWPHAIITGAPCSVCIISGKHQKVARAHKIELRERTVQVTVDDYTVAPYSAVPVCALCCARQTVNAHTVTMRLADIETIEKNFPPETPPCGYKLGVPSMTISNMKGGVVGMAFGPHISIDAPVDFETFKAAVLEQKQKVLSGYVSDDPPPEIVEASQASKHGGGMGGNLTTMTAMMGVMQQQQRMGAQMGGGMQMGAMGGVQLNGVQVGGMQGMQHNYGMQVPPSYGAPPPTYGAPPPMNMGRGPGFPVAGAPQFAEPEIPMAVAVPQPVVTDVDTMSPADVGRVLSELNLAKYAASFEKEGVDGNLFLSLDDAALSELGVDSSLARKKIMQYIEQHRK